MRVLTVENVKKVEAYANESGILYLQLMENAGSYCGRIIRKTFANTDKKNVLIVCGKGKNGGDGFVIARKLYENNYNVTVMMAMGLPADDISSEMLSRVRALNIPVVYYDKDGTTDKYIQNAQLIVDCIFGIGFHGEPDADIGVLFNKINSSDATVISIDIPSGLEGDSGKINGTTILADITIAILTLKPVHVLKPSMENCGKVVLAPIGIPEKCFSKARVSLFTVNTEEVRGFFPKRDAMSHKGTYGTVLVIGGSYEMPNAVYFASQGAVNCGAGIVKVAFPAVMYPAIAPKTCEQVLVPLENNQSGRISQNAVRRLEKEMKKSSCVIIGCGMGRDDDTRAVTKYVIENSEVPVIIDADGINCLKDNLDVLDKAKAPVVLTPHPREMSRITGVPVDEIQKNRRETVKAFVKEHKCVLVLKGASTLVGSSDYDDMYVNFSGNPGMATGGSGDVLSGIIASFVSQGVDTFRSAVSGVYIHGMAGDDVTAKYSMMGNTPSLILKELPTTLGKIEKG
ncbi:MAG: NAD(P)H-hydrate dehydratase [Clostridia bacterium]|nr:NAD(P)H-hydrate dehydratase [Clostridia bacterium]